MRRSDQDSVRLGLSRSDGSQRRALHRTRTFDPTYNQKKQSRLASYPKERRKYSRAWQANRQNITRQKAPGHLRFTFRKETTTERGRKRGDQGGDRGEMRV